MASHSSIVFDTGVRQPIGRRWQVRLRWLLHASVIATLLLTTLQACGQAATPGFAMQALYHDRSAPLTVMVAAALNQPGPGAGNQGAPVRTVTPAMRGPAPATILPGASAAGGPTLPGPAVGADTVLDVPGLAANGSAPANISAAAGAGQIVQQVDSQLAVYRQSDGKVLLGPVDSNALFRDFAGGPGAEACRLHKRGKAQVQFDATAQRWLFSQLAWGDALGVDGPYLVCMALSESADASGPYRRYVYPARNAQGRSVFPDDPSLAIWPDAYFVTSVAFAGQFGSYLGPQVCAFDRKAMLAGSDALARCRDLPIDAGPVLAASMEGSNPPPQTANYLMGLELDADGHGQHLLLWRFSFSTDSLTSPPALAVAPFTIACPGKVGATCISQPAPGEMLDARSDRLMPRLVYWAGPQGAVLLANHSVQLETPGAAPRVGLRWYAWRVQADAVRLAHQATFAPDSDSRWLGSIGIDHQGGIVLAYSVSGPATFPGIRYSAGTLESGLIGEGVITNGSGVQIGNGGLWGARSSLTRDGSNPCLLWASGPFIASTGASTWRTQIASLRFPSCH